MHVNFFRFYSLKPILCALSSRKNLTHLELWYCHDSSYVVLNFFYVEKSYCKCNKIQHLCYVSACVYLFSKLSYCIPHRSSMPFPLDYQLFIFLHLHCYFSQQSHYHQNHFLLKLQSPFQIVVILHKLGARIYNMALQVFLFLEVFITIWTIVATIMQSFVGN